MRIVRALFLTAGVVLAALGQAAAQTGQSQAATPANLDEYVKLVRADVQKQKVQIIGQNLELSASESATFWPLYKAYDTELAKIGDQRVANIKDYAANYTKLTDVKANELVDRALALEEQRLALIKRTLADVRKALPAAKAARFYQVEMSLNKLLDLQIASEIPLAK